MSTTITAGVTTTTAMDVAKSFYPDFSHTDLAAAAESIDLFRKDVGFTPRSAAELESWLDNGNMFNPADFNPATYEGGMAATDTVPVDDSAALEAARERDAEAAYESRLADIYGDDTDDDAAELAELEAAERRAAELRAKREAKAAAPKPIPVPQPKGIIGAGSVTATAALDRKTLGQMFEAQFGFGMPKSWNRLKVAQAMHGSETFAGPVGKKCAQWHYTRATGGVVPAQSWTVARLTTELSKTEPTVPKSSASKAAATLAYVKLTGFMPAKSWNIQTIVDNTRNNVLPRSHRKAASVVNGAIVLA